MIVFRILPGNDIKKSLENFTIKNGIKSGIILCLVGSIENAVLRMSNGDKKVFKGYFELVSCEGTLSEDGIHVHISLSDEEGRVFGGHLLEGCKIYTTAEIGIIESDVLFKRVHDPETGYKELVVL